MKKTNLLAMFIQKKNTTNDKQNTHTHIIWIQEVENQEKKTPAAPAKKWKKKIVSKIADWGKFIQIISICRLNFNDNLL